MEWRSASLGILVKVIVGPAPSRVSVFRLLLGFESVRGEERILIAHADRFERAERKSVGPLRSLRLRSGQAK